MKIKRQYKFYPQSITNFAGYMTEEEALDWLSKNSNAKIIGLEVIEFMTAKQAYEYLESLKQNARTS